MEESQKVSQYNDAGLQIFRLNELWIDCHRHRRDGKLLAYKHDLEEIESELYADIILRLDKDNKNEKDKYETRLKLINFEILKYQLMQKVLLFDLKLREKHQLLRIVQEVAKKGSKLKDADEDGFDD